MNNEKISEITKLDKAKLKSKNWIDFLNKIQILFKEE